MFLLLCGYIYIYDVFPRCKPREVLTQLAKLPAMDVWLSLCFVASSTLLALWFRKSKPKKRLPPGPWSLPIDLVTDEENDDAKKQPRPTGRSKTTCTITHPFKRQSHSKGLTYTRNKTKTTIEKIVEE